MSVSETLSAVLALTLAAAVLGPASAQPYGRGASERAHERNQDRREQRREKSEDRRGEGQYRGSDDRELEYAASPTGSGPAYAYPPPVYARPPAYAAPPPYAPNSLGAGWGQQQDAARRGVRQGALVPLGEVMTRIRRGTPGRLLDAGLEPGPDGRPAYRVRWAAANGRRIDFIVDAATGAIVGSNGY